MDNPDINDCRYIKKYQDMQDRLYALYDGIEAVEAKESLIYSVIHADGIFLRPAASQKPRNSAAIPSVSFLAGCKNLLVIAKTSLNQRFPKITEVQSRLQNIQQQKISGDNIYQFLLYFDKLYHKFNDAEKKELIVSFVESVGIYEQEQLNGRILKSI